MNTSKSLWGFVALTLLLAVPKVADASATNVSLLLSTQAVGQAKPKPATERQELESMLGRARQALKKGDLETAEALLSSAEQMQVDFNLFHRGDTPRKLRADLNAAKRKKPVRPSEKFEAKLPSESAVTTAAAVEPQTRQTPKVPTEVLDPNDEVPLALPQSEGRIKPLPAPLAPVQSPEREPAGGLRPAMTKERSTAVENPDEARHQSDSQLLAARRALAVGDVKRATTCVEAARKAGASYGYHDDTPDKVDAAIRNYRQVMEVTQGRDDEAARVQLAGVLMDQAQQLYRWRDFDEAERLSQHVKGMRISYGPFDVKPDALLERIAVARKQPAGVEPEMAQRLPATAPNAAGQPATPPGSFPVARAVYSGKQDGSRVQTASAQEEVPAEATPDAATPAETTEDPVGRLPESNEPAQPIPGNLSDGMRLFAEGTEALKQRDTQRALEHFREAYKLRDQLDPVTAQRLQDHLQLLSVPPSSRGGAKPELLIDSATSKALLLAKQVSNDLSKQEAAADKVREKEPRKAMDILKQARATVEASGLDPEHRAQMLRRVDRRVAELDKYIVDNRAQIELDEKNKEILKEVDRRLQGKLEVDNRLAELVDEFNKLMDQERWAEAEVLAKRARELDPENPVVKQLIWQSKFISRTTRNRTVVEDKEKGFWTSLQNVDESAVPFNDNDPYQYGDVKEWNELTKSRRAMMSENRSRRNERELEIERKLKTPVSLKFRERALSEVLEHLAKLAAVNYHLDPKGLEEEGVSADTPVTIDLTTDISLKSALNLILEPLHLSYVIRDEVLKITSEQLRDGEVVTKTYDVADLVIPIPNFGPNGRFGLAGAIGDAYNMTGTGVGLSPGAGFMANNDAGSSNSMMNPAVLAQVNSLMPGNGAGRMASGMGQPTNMGPGGLGGGSQADFDSLIELITTTVKPQTWDEVGGPGSVSPFQNNLSLVISQTEDVHEEIVDLLEQLRRNQDLQVTIEVRFITLNDNFFERIGVDFDFNVVNTGASHDPRSTDPKVKNEIVGLNNTGPGAAGFPNYTGDLSIPFRQESFDLAVPQFGTPVPVASFGFAILSDLEAFLLVQAAQGDRRSNVLQAPKVTLFNGQQASVVDVVQSPFVISVIPVVGDFAAAYQPVITVLSEGAMLTVQAIISHDRRFVRLTVLPLFSQIGDVTEFKFSGSTTTTSNQQETQSTGASGGGSSGTTDDTSTTSDGVTVQLPNFSVVSVTTTVSVPDGGTVLLGGIKRLSEGRNEFGVPILSKLPYINRLFKNVGIGRETQSLMMMVTPRIIIQEEEEERLGIVPAP